MGLVTVSGRTKVKYKNISVNIAVELNERLDSLSSLTGRPKTFYIRECLRKYITELEETYSSHTLESSDNKKL
ncbi:CopG family transcriptional regulator [Moraxella bovis]|uniref:CopG family transcriptional regulator n=1 Tax=Moraxella bovis TaxID=476 RepID=UPI00117D6336|nr:CopG family transcriptional regulator [Moraxella bovis]